MPGHTYDPGFFDYIHQGSLASARVVCPAVTAMLAPRSVLDVGSGAGAWCRGWLEAGASEVLGLDGDYVDRTRLLIEPECFRAQDLSQPFDLGRRFDLAVSLEVAEHLAIDRARVFVDNLVRHADRVLFSAAVPGQGGEHHVNEQPLSYWRVLFASHGYRLFDPIRPRIQGESTVEPWYRYNTLLYVEGGAVVDLPREVLCTEVPEGTPIAELAPATWRARNAILRRLPTPAIEGLAQLKHAVSRKLRPPQR